MASPTIIIHTYTFITCSFWLWHTKLIMDSGQQKWARWPTMSHLLLILDSIPADGWQQEMAAFVIEEEDEDKLKLAS